MPLTFHTLDVFTRKRYSGNALAVVMDADAVPEAQMQAIAREFNLSETVFVMKPRNSAHSARVRIFTPSYELPFAGHPTIGTAALLAGLSGQDVNGEHDALVTLEQDAGTVRVGVRLRAGEAAYAEFDAPKLPEPAGGLPSTDRLSAALGLLPGEIGLENHKPVRFAASNAFAFVPVSTLEALGRAEVNAAHWASAFSGQGVVGAYLYTRECIHNTAAFHARMFAPDAGIPEDPATGSAAAGFAGVVHQFDGLPNGTHKRIIEQGYEMGRPSEIVLTMVVNGGKLETVRIGGHAVRVSEGQLTM